MNTQLVPFVFEGHEIRAVTINGEAWFVAADVTAVLGFGNSRQAIATHVDSDDRDGVQILDVTGRSQRHTVINSFAVFSLILGSSLPDPKRFKRWVTHEVLPQIQQTGQFSLGTPMLCIKPTKWTRMFPREFYVQIFRLKSKVMPEDLSTEPWLGPLTIDLICERLEEYLWEALQKMDPFIGRWRKRKLHQHFADGEPKARLQAFIWECVGSMSSFEDNSWALFMSHWNHRHPGRRVLVNKLTFNCADGQLSLPFELL